MLVGARVSVVGDGPAFSSGAEAGDSRHSGSGEGVSYDGVSRVAEDLKARLERVPRADVRITSGGWGWE